MSPGLAADALMAKAERALQSARILLAAEDVDGACNRAYYAMFDAARAALLATRAPVPPEIARTHGGLIAAFGLHIVKPGLLPMEMGRMLNWAEDLRLVADYRGESISIGDVRAIVEQAATFVGAVSMLRRQA